jgi:hypothetical protein
MLVLSGTGSDIEITRLFSLLNAQIIPFSELQIIDL